MDRESAIIGNLVSIANGRIEATLRDSAGTYVSVGAERRFVGEIGSYVAMYEDKRHIIGEIIGVTLSIGSSGLEPQPMLVQIGLIGEIGSGRFRFGVSCMPHILSKVRLISPEDLAIMLSVSDSEIPDPDIPGQTRVQYLPIGRSVVFPDREVMVNMDKLFGFHFAVLGNTGAGKSNTIASIIQKIFRKTGHSARGAKFIIIDSNGEYGRAFSRLHDVNPDIHVKFMTAADEENEKNRLEIPVWALTADDWAILLNASERTQIPILQRAIDIARNFFGWSSNAAIKNHILASSLMGILNSSDTSPSKKDKIVAVLTGFYTEEINLMVRISGNYTLRDALTVSYGEMKEMERILDYLKKYIRPDVTDQAIPANQTVRYTMQQFYEAVTFATLYEGSISSQSIEAYTTPLVTRLQSLKDAQQGSVFTQTLCFSIEEYVLKLLAGNQVINIDISMLDDLSAEVVVKVLAKLLLDYLKQRSEKADMPINFIMEEAHRFVKENTDYGVLGYNIFERIAKEGRKYGFLLGISSQRPSELSKTVISQCSNFIIHRIQNPDDLKYISQMVPYINQNVISRLTYLQTGHALVFGTALNLPSLAQFDRADPQTDSDNAAISERWYV